VIFENVDFKEMSERGNLFHKVNFSNCKFNKAGIGYEGSQYQQCLIEKSSFTKTVFIRGEFVNTQFVLCKLKGVDFNASSFEDCSFVGKLEDVWFRGGYAYVSDDENFGKAKKNQMRNVSFSDAILEGVNFSNGCDLSTIHLPITSNYILFNNWKIRLEHLKEVIKKWSISHRKEAEIFSSSYLVHAKTQDWFIVNIEELQRDFGVDVANIIIIELNRKTF
jgi:fluoroquinolone resistance protein